MTFVLQATQHDGTTIFVDLCLTFSATDQATDGSTGNGTAQIFFFDGACNCADTCPNQHSLTGTFVGVVLGHDAALFLISGKICTCWSSQLNLTIQGIGTCGNSHQSG